MDTAVGDEAEQMHAVAALEGGAQYRALVERPVLDRLVHAHQILVEPASRADGEMADLAVAHLAGREPGGLARGLDRRVRELAPQRVEDRRVCQLDGVPRPAGRTAPAVEDHQGYRRLDVDSRRWRLVAHTQRISRRPSGTGSGLNADTALPCARSVRAAWSEPSLRAPGSTSSLPGS